MKTLEIKGKLSSQDVWLSEPGVGTIILASKIVVPESLESKGFYEAEVTIRTVSGDSISFHTDVSIEPEQVDAIGEKRPRILGISTSIVMGTSQLDGADVRLLIQPLKKDVSAEVRRVRHAMSNRSASLQR